MNLLQTARELEGHSLLAVDDEIGSVEGFYLDDTTWAIRYLLVNPGRQTGKRVLIVPAAIGEIDEKERSIYIELTRNQIENSPPVRTDGGPVSRQYEAEYYQYYDWTPYWEHGQLSGFPIQGSTMAPPPDPGEFATAEMEETHLRSTMEIIGYVIAAQDGEIGYVDDLIVDTQYWVIRYLEIDTRDSWSGKQVLVNPGWIEEISRTGHAVSLDLTREAIMHAPDVDPSKAISRDYERRLFRHYGRPFYWRRGNGKF
ncbi:MAG: hypothetical protein WBS20_14580 [Lysobacterales bacterium]